MTTIACTQLIGLGTCTALTAIATGASPLTGIVAGALSLSPLFNPALNGCSKLIKESATESLGIEGGKALHASAHRASLLALQIITLYGTFFLSHSLLGVGSFSLMQTGICSITCSALSFNESLDGSRPFYFLGKLIDACIKQMFPPQAAN